MEDNNLNDWRSDVNEEGMEVLKILNGETKTFTFLDEGSKKNHADFGTSIVFKVSESNIEKNFYVNAQNYDLLGQIKQLGSLIRMKVKCSRTGTTKSDTRYTIEKVD